MAEVRDHDQPPSAMGASGSVGKSAGGRLSTLKIVGPLLPWVVVVLAWEVMAKREWINLALFPPPSDVVRYFVESRFSFGMGREAVTMHASIIGSFLRVLGGLGIGFGTAVLSGVLISQSRLAAAAFMPLVRGLAPIAPIAWIPLGIALFGIGNPTALFIVFIGVYFILTIATVAAVASVDDRLIKTAKTLGASNEQIWARVVLPSVLPQVFTMLRLNFFGAWMAVLAAEMVGLRNGLGAIIIMGREMFNAHMILGGMALIGLTGYAVDSLLLFLQKHLLWWQGGTGA